MRVYKNGENMQSIWKSENYYQIAHDASKHHIHPKIKELADIAKNCDEILEIGCGEGTKLDIICNHKSKGTGVDISPIAIKKAILQYPQYKFIQADGEKLPFDDNKFDLVYSAFTLEHTQNPEKVIKEMIRVAQKGAYLSLLAPNYGAPFRKSPCFRGHRIIRIVQGFWNDLIKSFNSQLLNWHRVLPIADSQNFEIDFDTTVEPYLGSLLDFIRSLNGLLIRVSSCWEIEEKHETMINKAFRYLATKSIYPFIYWGPHLFVVWQKKS